MEVWRRLHLNHFDFHSGLLAAGLRALLSLVSGFEFQVPGLIPETRNSEPRSHFGTETLNSKPRRGCGINHPHQLTTIWFYQLGG
jgi:hypothetical protein